jgi:hypothetical protein
MIGGEEERSIESEAVGWQMRKKEKDAGLG